jgi:hypothetical protein
VLQNRFQLERFRGWNRGSLNGSQSLPNGTGSGSLKLQRSQAAKQKKNAKKCKKKQKKQGIEP